MSEQKKKSKPKKKAHHSENPLVVCTRRNPGYDIFAQSCEVLGVDFSDNSNDIRIATCAAGFKLDSRFMSEVSEAAKLSRFPGSKAACEKDTQAWMFDFARRICSKEFSFWPPTFVLPSQISQLEQFLEHNKRNNITMICKPAAASQGDGIFLFTDLDSMKRRCASIYGGNTYICQRYVDNPLLFHGLKFDLRLYVLVSSLEPLQIHICTEGMVRFCTQKYQKPDRSNLHHVMGHLTNYSLNRTSSDYIHSDRSDDTNATKRTLTTFWQQLNDEFPSLDLQRLWVKIRAVCHTSMKAVATCLVAGNTVYPDHALDAGRAWQIFGLDILLDSDFQPHLLEINAGPSLSIDGVEEVAQDYEPGPSEKICRCMKNPNPHIHKISPVDTLIKSIVVQGALAIVLNLQNSTARKSWEILEKPAMPSLDFVSRFLLDQFLEITQRVNFRWALRKNLAHVFSSKLGAFDVEIFLSSPLAHVRASKTGDEVDDKVNVMLQIYQVFFDLAQKIYQKKGLKKEPLLYHIENHVTSKEVCHVELDANQLE